MATISDLQSEDEPFTVSNCKCDFCIGTHVSIMEWETFTAKTELQRNMLRVVDRIEKREASRKRKSQRKQPIVNLKTLK